MKVDEQTSTHFPYCNTSCNHQEHFLSNGTMRHLHPDHQATWCAQCQHPDDTVVTKTFEEELRALLNRYSMESGSDTPDFILAAFIGNVLTDYAHAVKARDRWYGTVETDETVEG